MSYAITFLDDTVCVATRVLGLAFPHDPNGDRTVFYAQINGHRRRINPKDVKTITRDWE